MERGAEMEAKLDDHRTPLHAAVQNGKVAVVQSLLDHGANVQAHAKELWTPLHRASWNGDPDVVRILLEHGADVEAPDDDHDTNRGNRP